MADVIRTIDYPIYIGNDSLNELANYFKLNGFKTYHILVDENTKMYCLPAILDHLNFIKNLNIIEIKSGESNKNLETCKLVWDALTNQGAGRNSVLINIGGGVISDLGGFVAKTFKRGMHFINIPTTLLSQVDASIGGKLGVDFNGFKNHIGLFGFPNLIIIDTSFYQTLDNRELRSGFAEVIKHALIKDEVYWKELTKVKRLEDMEWNSCLSRSIHVKNIIVEQDPYENGLRKALNFGHTIGHAFETYFLGTNKHLLHGEAVALGMIMEAHLSMQKNLLSRACFDELTLYILNYFGKADIEGFEWDVISDYMRQDKKNVGDQISFTLLNSIGNVSVDQFVEQEQIIKAIAYYESL